VEDIYFIQCVTGGNKDLGNGQDHTLILGELQVIYKIIGNLLLIFWINKLV